MKSLVSKGAQLLINAALRTTGKDNSPGSKIDNMDIAKAIEQGAQIAKDKVMYIRSDVGGSNGRKEILNAAVVKKLGTTNFDNGALPKNRAMIITHLRIASMVSATGINADEYSPVITDAALANGEIYIQTQDGKELYQGPVGQMIPTAAPVNQAETWYELENPILLQPGQNVQIDFWFAGAATADTYLEVALKGVENVQR